MGLKLDALKLAFDTHSVTEVRNLNIYGEETSVDYESSSAAAPLAVWLAWSVFVITLPATIWGLAANLVDLRKRYVECKAQLEAAKNAGQPYERKLSSFKINSVFLKDEVAETYKRYQRQSPEEVMRLEPYELRVELAFYKKHQAEMTRDEAAAKERIQLLEETLAGRKSGHSQNGHTVNAGDVIGAAGLLAVGLGGVIAAASR